MVEYVKIETKRHQKELLIALICTIILVSVFYVYCISFILMETVKRDKNFENLQLVRREYQELEKNYLDLISKFSLDYAYSLGFVGENSLAYISRQTPVAQNSDYDKALR